MKLSAVINTKNAAATLEKCLKSVKFADEIIIVDMQSTDDTVKIAHKYTKNIFSHEDVGYADPARDFALSKATNEWILVVDADEEISIDLKKKIKEVVSSDKQQADVYWLPRKNIVFGKWIEKTGWWPDYQVRLFKNGKVSWKVGVHRHPDLEGKVDHFPAEEKLAIIHHNYQSLEQFIDRLNRYTTLQAEERLSDKSNSDKNNNYSSPESLEKFFSEFLMRFFDKQGVDEGIHGLNLSLLQSLYELTVYLKEWQINKFPKTDKDQEETFVVLRKFQKDLNYWIADWKVKNSSGISKVFWQMRRKFKI